MKTVENTQNVVSFSGGRTSAYLVWALEQKKKNEGWRVHYVFMDTGLEHPKTYEFIKNVVKYFNINLACLRLRANPIIGKGNFYEQVDVNEIGCDFEPWKQMLTKYGTPTNAAPFCTSRMKTEIHKKYCDKWFGNDNYFTWLGIREDEKHRKLNNYFIKHLFEISDYDKSDILAWWKNAPFDLQIEEHLGNCVFCIKKGVTKLALAAKECPELATKFIRMVNAPYVRNLEGKGTIPNSVMYRQYMSLESIIKTYEDWSIEQLRNSIRFTKPSERAKVCEESCEVFNLDNCEI